MRDTIAAAVAGDTIVFSGVTTVTLTSAELLINKKLTIDGGTNGVTITRSGARHDGATRRRLPDALAERRAATACQQFQLPGQ